MRAIPKVMEKIESVYKIVSRRHNLQEKRQIAKTKMAATERRRRGELHVRPEWALRRNSVHVIDEPLRAITFVMNSINLLPS